jgi:hypothetical protein
MNDYKVLYYPDFAPDPTWLRKILLLSDGVVRIVPADVDPKDPDDLKRLQDEMQGCLSSVGPDENDVAIEHGDEPRLARMFALLGQKGKGEAAHIDITISSDGRLAIADHVFVHDSKLSSFVQEELQRNGLLIESAGDLAPERFLVVREDASDIILAGLASKMASRLGLDVITDKPMPFAFGALRGVPGRSLNDGAAEGALLGSVAAIMIPAAVATIEPRQYREIRDSYAGIREAFKALTSEWAILHRLTRLTDASELAARAGLLAQDFDRQCREYRRSRHARAFRSWTPLCIGGVLSVAASVAAPLLAPGIAVASVGIQVVEKWLSGQADTADERVFNMLSGLRRDIITHSGIREVV